MTTPKRLLLTLHGIVPDRVAPLVLHEIAAANSGSTVEADPAGRTVSVQAGWWYRGETTVTTHELGSLVTQQVFDIAERAPWAVRLVSGGSLGAAPRTLAATLEKIGRQLDCPAYPQA
ncbi:MAG: hypothetical protein M3024_13615 [Candidatus Dormibacteraeota bacterium]|nr:hypothetical protein [Candidatus Dormibacteraeota bacterium]